MPRAKKAAPRSLVHLFEPPEGFVGRFGWLCGYSADVAFLDKAVERFTQLTAPRRAYSGVIAMGLMLDSGNPQIAPVDVPGLLQLPMLRPDQRTFALLHAKVALLGFRHERETSDWWLRLIVSTGNWTRHTLEESLDLAWSVDLGRTALQQQTDAVRQARADIAAAADFMRHVRNLFDTRVFTRGASEFGPTELDSWLDAASKGAELGRARFFDNRHDSLLAQLRKQVGRVSSDTAARNYLAMGSGFFEGEADGARATLPELIVKALRGSGKESALLTATPEVNLFVNPLACQGMAAFARRLPQRWSLHRPFPKEEVRPWRRRDLHAKFLFSANWRDDAEYCSSAWLYLGSGNLTNPGFMNAAHRDRGNLEAGAVLGVEGVRWSELSDLLPVDELDGRSPIAVEELSAGAGMEERVETFCAPPVPFLTTEYDGAQCWLVTLDVPGSKFEALSPAGGVCTFEPGRGFFWPTASPRQVRLRWQDSGTPCEADVPVIDAFGRVAGIALGKIDLSDAWAQLADFPLPPPEEDLEDADAADLSGDRSPDAQATAAAPPSRYAIRELMTLVENIATLQERLSQSDWRTWCCRLEQTLALASESEGARLCHAFGINLLSPLRQAEFRPTFAESESTPEGQMYNAVLQRIELAWRVSTLPSLGVVE